MQYIVLRICLNVTGKTNEMITQGKRARADSLDIQVLIRNMWRELLVYYIMSCGAFLCLPMPSGLSLAFRFFVSLFLLLKKKSKTFLLISI